MNLNLNNVKKYFNKNYDVVNSLLMVYKLAIYEATHVTKYNKNLDEYNDQFNKQDKYYYKCFKLIKWLVSNYGWITTDKKYKDLTNKNNIGLHDVLNLVNYSLNKILRTN